MLSLRTNKLSMKERVFGVVEDTEDENAHFELQLRQTQLLHNEIVDTCKLVATSTSAFNALSRGQKRLRTEIAAYLPSPPKIFPALSTQLSHLHADFDMLSVIQSFHARVEFVSRLSQQFLSSGAQMMEDPAELEYVTDAWQSLCGHAICIIYELEGLILAQKAVSRPSNTQEVVALLQAARDGSVPCMLGDRIMVPGWAERRKHERLSTNQNAVLRTAAGEEPVRISNISRGGLCIAGVPNIKIGQPVSIVLAQGRLLAGHVRWAHNGSAGVKFDQILAENDPLLPEETAQK